MPHETVVPGRAGAGDLHRPLSSSSLPWTLLRVLALLERDGLLPKGATLLDLSRLSEREILAFPGVGVTSLGLIKAELKRCGGKSPGEG